MNSELIGALGDVLKNVSFQKEVLKLEDTPERSDKIFELCKKYTNKEFTKEEFEVTLNECFIWAFENLEIIRSVENLESVAGGKAGFKKIGASALAVSMLLGGVPGVNFDISPKVSAETPPILRPAVDTFKKLDPTSQGIIAGFIILNLPGIYKLYKSLWTPFANDIIKPSVAWFKDTFIYNRKKLINDPVEFRKVALEFLQKNIFAQDKAVNEVVSIISGHIDMWKESKNTGKPCTSACVMTFIGDSGTGKTYCARLLSQLLFGKDMQSWQFITSSSIKTPPPPSKAPKVNIYFNKFTGEKSDDDKSAALADLSPADRLFSEKSEIVRELQKNNNVIIVIDEIDKIHKNDPQDTILERLRDAKDTGRLRVHLENGGYEDIDVSRTTFICISNEFRECWGLPQKELTPAQAAARTTVVRDKSLVNRFDVVEFDNFKVEDYMTILHPLTEHLKKAYLQAYNMDIIFSPNFAKDIALVASEKNKGVRGLNDFLVKLRGALVDVRSKNKIKPVSNVRYSEDKDSWRVKIAYDRSRDQFTTVAEKVPSDPNVASEMKK